MVAVRLLQAMWIAGTLVELPLQPACSWVQCRGGAGAAPLYAMTGADTLGAEVSELAERCARLLGAGGYWFDCAGGCHQGSARV
jgi:hypothetical protein